MPAYTYRSLSGPSTVRILQILPRSKGSDRIECCLAEYSLADTGKAHHYEALSYVWGNQKDIQSILLNGNDFQVGQNLFRALLHIRDDQLVRHLWVDAICINQNDDDEKASQIALMRDIYGHAYRVLVWLGDLADNSDEAFETIRLAGEQALPGNAPLQQRHPVSAFHQAACLELLRRDWFRRIWVLQEVAVARNISIMCGNAEIHGHMFCLGLRSLNLHLDGQVYATLNLMDGAIARPRYTSNSRGSLSMAELMDMYHTRSATKSHDKIYALLGLSCDDPKSAALIPDYNVPWDILLQRFVAYVLPQTFHVQSLPDRESILLTGKGYTIGRISSVEGYRSSNKQLLEIDLVYTVWAKHFEEKWGCRWEIGASAKVVQKGDVVFLLEGASRPSIIRLRKGYPAIIVLAATSRQTEGTHAGRLYRQNYCSLEEKACDVSLIWSLNSSFPPLGRIDENEHTLQYPGSNVHGKLKQGTREIVEDLVVERITVTDWIAVELILDRVGTTLPVTEKVLKATASSREESDFIHTIESWSTEGLPISSEVIEAAARNRHVAGLRLIQHYCKELKKHITDNVLKAALTYIFSDTYETIKILREMSGEGLPVTEDALKLVAKNRYLGSGYDTVVFLCKHGGGTLPITEDVLKLAAGHNTYEGVAILLTLCEHAGESPPITEDVLQAAARGEGEFGHLIMNILFDYGDEHLPITEAILCRVARNDSKNALNIMKLLCRRFGKSLPITETVLCEVAGNRGENAPPTMEFLCQWLEGSVSITEAVLWRALTHKTPEDGEDPEYGNNPDLPSLDLLPLPISNEEDRRGMTAPYVNASLLVRRTMIQHLCYYCGANLPITDKMLTYPVHPSIKDILRDHALKTRSGSLGVQGASSKSYSVRDHLKTFYKMIRPSITAFGIMDIWDYKSHVYSVQSILFAKGGETQFKFKKWMEL